MSRMSSVSAMPATPRSKTQTKTSFKRMLHTIAVTVAFAGCEQTQRDQPERGDEERFEIEPFHFASRPSPARFLYCRTISADFTSRNPPSTTIAISGNQMIACTQ